MHDVTTSILNGVKEAHSTYRLMSGGRWLSHAPEYFITTSVARALFFGGFYVYMDATLRRIARDDFQDARALKSKAIDIRPDITLWDRSGQYAQASIEIKSTYDVSLFRKDISRLDLAINTMTGGTAAFMLVYSDDAKKRETYDRRYHEWSKKIKWSKYVVHHGDEVDEDGYRWSACVFTHPKSQKIITK